MTYPTDYTQRYVALASKMTRLSKKIRNNQANIRKWQQEYIDCELMIRALKQRFKKN